MRLFLASFILGFFGLGQGQDQVQKAQPPATHPAPTSTVEQRFAVAEGMSCKDVMVEEGATALDCGKFMESWNNAKAFYGRFVGGSDKVQASSFRFVKIAGNVVNTKTGVPGYALMDPHGEINAIVTSLFSPAGNVIIFTVEESVMWSSLQGIDYYLHPTLVRHGAVL